MISFGSIHFNFKQRQDASPPSDCSPTCETTPTTHIITTMSVAQFNRLPRAPLAPSGLVPNHWHFSLRHVPLPPAGLVLYIINPAARFVHVPGRIPPSLETAPIETKAEVIIGILLSAFTKRDLNQSRPWSWSTNDAALASAMGGKLRTMGVADGLDVVGVAPAEENSIADEEWTNFFNKLREFST